MAVVSLLMIHFGYNSKKISLEKIKQIIESEDPKKPYSDSKISQILKETNIDIARRTVAKYREMLKFLPASKRKQFY